MGGTSGNEKCRHKDKFRHKMNKNFNLFCTASPLIEEMMNYNNMQQQSTAILRHILDYILYNIYILDPTQNQHAFMIRSEAGVLIIESN